LKALAFERQSNDYQGEQILVIDVVTNFAKENK
jgi:hypothetical protein